MMAKRAAVIDVGTNSIKLLIAEKSGAGFKTICERIRVVGLGEGLAKNGFLCVSAMARGEKVTASFVALARRHCAGEIAVFGTHAIRKAANSAEFARRIMEKTGIALKELSGEEEAFYAFSAAVLAVGKNGKSLVFDAGGGSTEFILGDKRAVQLSCSTQIGALTLFDECLSENDPPTAEELEVALRLAKEIFGQADEVFTEAKKKEFTLIGIGGIISVLSSVAMKLKTFSRAEIEGTRLTAAEIRAQMNLYGSSALKQRRLIPGMPKDRARVAPAGAVLALAVLESVGKEFMIVGTGGLRHGAMMELLGIRSA